MNSTLPSKEITKERGAIIQEIDMYEDMPMQTIDNVFDALLFGEDHPLGRTILGPKENIRSFSRNEFIAYLKRNYTPQNTVVCISGSFDSKAVLKKVTRDFSVLKKSDAPALIPFTEIQTTARVAIKEKKTDQTQLMLGLPAYPYLHKDEFVLAVLSTILGGGMSSRLFLEVREKRGLAYSVQSWADQYIDTGYFVVQAGVEHAKLEKAVQTILAELKKIKRTAVSKAELEKAKSYIKGTMILSLETSDRIAQRAATSLLEIGRVRSLEEILEGIENVTSADVQRVAKDLFKTEKLNLAVIGPHGDTKPFERLLKL